MPTQPPITFLMAVHNGAATVLESIHSVLAQTFPDLCLLLIDDASTDSTPQLLRSLNDPRIRILTNPENLGLAASLNIGLQNTSSEFIARIDADDFALPQRAAAQLAFLNANPDVAVLGSAIETFSADSPPTTLTYPRDPAPAMLFRSTLAHPAVVFRRAALAHLPYEPQFRYAQDYALWFNCIQHHLQLANLPEVLLRYRLHAGQLSAANDLMQGEGTAVRNRFLHHFHPAITTEELALHEALSRNRLLPDPAFLLAAARWLEKIAALNQSQNTFHHETLLQTLTGRYVALIRLAHAHHLSAPDITQTPFCSHLHPNAQLLPKPPSNR